MTRARPKSGALPRNPLAVISSLIAVVEIAFAYPVTKLVGANQTIVVVFMVAFPVLLLTGFFATVWFKPGHLYSPKDYESASDFLAGIGKASAIPPRAAQDPSAQRPTSSGPDRGGVVEPNTRG